MTIILKTNFLDFPLFPLPGEVLPEGRLQGEGQKNLLALYEAATADEQAQLLDFLGKVLGAAKVDLHQDARFYSLTSGESLSFARCLRPLRPRVVLLFGISGERLGLRFPLPLYEIQDIAGIQFMAAHPLSSIWEERQAGGKEKSAQLWRALKILFL